MLSKEKPFYYYQKMGTICLTIIAAGVVTAILVYTKAVLIPLVISIFLYTILMQMTRLLHNKLSFPKWLAVAVSIIVFLAFFTAIVLFTVNSVGGFLKGAELYKENLLGTAADLISRAQAHGIDIDKTSILSYLKELPVFNWLKNFGGKLFSLISNSTLIMLFIIFFLLGGKKTPPITNETIKEMMNNVSIYLSVKTITSLATGLIIAIILLAFKVKLALLFALFAFLLNFIPSVGSIIAVLLPVPVLFLQFGLGGHLCLIVGLLTATEFIIGNLIEPRFLGDGMDLHPAVVIASLIFWGLVWGAPGAFLSVPITASVKIILSKIKHTRPVAELLAGRLPH